MRNEKAPHEKKSQNSERQTPELGYLSMSQDKAVRLRCFEVKGFSSEMINRAASFLSHQPGGILRGKGNDQSFVQIRVSRSSRVGMWSRGSS